MNMSTSMRKNVSIRLRVPKMLLLLMLLGLGMLITGCSQGGDMEGAAERVLTSEEIFKVFAGQGLELTSVDVSEKNVFQRELNEHTPLVFLLEEKELVVYQYASAEERDGGWADFENKTATADLVPYKAYQEQSLLVFYIHQDGMLKEGLDQKIKAAISALLEFKESGA